MGFDQMYAASVTNLDGDRLGSVGSIYLDDEGGTPVYVTVRTGLFGNRETYLPLDEAKFANNQLQVPYSADQIKQAPAVHSDAHLSPNDEAVVCRHYGVAFHLQQAEPAAVEAGQEPLGPQLPAQQTESS